MPGLSHETSPFFTPQKKEMSPPFALSALTKRRREVVNQSSFLPPLILGAGPAISFSRFLASAACSF